MTGLAQEYHVSDRPKEKPKQKVTEEVLHQIPSPNPNKIIYIYQKSTFRLQKTKQHFSRKHPFNKKSIFFSIFTPFFLIIYTIPI
ncbi:hypothetical protein AB3U99_10255 [Niallia sp. JL1B1071]|uniref:hypothetical protein n=1 Tax=Niallia tiangongensis TaxID=3237105 RepID=UPI0037DCEED7